MAIRILIVDDHPVVVEGLKSLLQQMKEVEISGAVFNAFEAMSFLKTTEVDVVLLDINLPDVSGIDLCKRIRKEYPQIKILGISTFADRSYISRMIDNGASGYLLKSATAEEITEAIHTVMKGKMYLTLSMEHVMRPLSITPVDSLPALTKREKEILSLIAAGNTNNQIAEALFISPLTVDTHRKNLMTKLNVNNTASLIRFAMEHGLI